MDKLIELFLESPNDAEEFIKEEIGKYKPALYEIANELFGIYKDLVANDEYFSTLAQMKWKMYSAYRNAGFTEEQAFTFMIKDHNDIQQLISALSKLQAPSEADSE
jgi:hypothetical protein